MYFIPLNMQKRPGKLGHHVSGDYHAVLQDGPVCPKSLLHLKK